MRERRVWGTLMWSYRAERRVPYDPSVARVAVADLVQAVWGARSRVILDDPAGERLDAISSVEGSDEADVWLTWEFAPVADGTHVRVRLDELERGPDPGEALVELLDALALAGDSDAPAHDA